MIDWLTNWMSEWVNESLAISPLGAQHSESGLQMLELQSGRATWRGRILHFENCWCGKLIWLPKLHRKVIGQKHGSRNSRVYQNINRSGDNPLAEDGIRQSGYEMERWESHLTGLKQQLPREGQLIQTKPGPQTLSLSCGGLQNSEVLPFSILFLVVVGSAENTARSEPPAAQQVPGHCGEKSSQASLF